MDKIYAVKVSHTRRGDRVVTGTLPYFLQSFSYILEIGASWDKKVNRHPKTFKSFLSSLQRSYEAKEASCYERTFVSDVTNVPPLPSDVTPVQ